MIIFIHYIYWQQGTIKIQTNEKNERKKEKLNYTLTILHCIYIRLYYKRLLNFSVALVTKIL